MKRVILSILVALAAFIQIMPQADNRPIFTSWEQDKLYPMEYQPIPEQEYEKLDSIMRIDELMMLANDTLNMNTFDTSNISNLHYYRAASTITVEGSYSIPVGTHVIFDAPHVNINYGLTCPIGATFEVRQEGCKN